MNLPPRYRGATPIGHGGTGLVFRADDAVRGVPVALKVIEGEAEVRVEQEFRVACGLKHPAIVQLHDLVWLSQGRALMVMELLTRDTLREVVSSADEPWRAAVKAGIDLASALAYLHEREIIHGDVKPPNVLRARSNLEAVKLVDFGFALGMRQAAGSSAGTPAFMAPELITGKSKSFASDVYALGVTLYEVIAGKNPFAADDLGTTLTNVARVAPPTLHSLGLAPPAVSAFVATLMARLPGQRPTARAAEQQAREVLADDVFALTHTLALQRPEWVGNEAVRAAGLEHACEGRGLLRIIGPKGSGRTRLLHDVSTHARAAGRPVLSVMATNDMDDLAAVVRHIVRDSDEEATARAVERTPHEVLAAALGSNGLLLVDDAELLAVAVRTALFDVCEALGLTVIAAVCEPIGFARGSSSRKVDRAPGRHSANSDLRIKALTTAEVDSLVRTALGQEVDPDVVPILVAAVPGWPGRLMEALSVGLASRLLELRRGPSGLRVSPTVPRAELLEAFAAADNTAARTALAGLQADSLQALGRLVALDGAWRPASAPERELAERLTRVGLVRRRGGSFAPSPGVRGLVRSVLGPSAEEWALAQIEGGHVRVPRARGLGVELKLNLALGRADRALAIAAIDPSLAERVVPLAETLPSDVRAHAVVAQVAHARTRDGRYAEALRAIEWLTSNAARLSPDQEYPSPVPLPRLRLECGLRLGRAGDFSAELDAGIDFWKADRSERPSLDACELGVLIAEALRQCGRLSDARAVGERIRHALEPIDAASWTADARAIAARASYEVATTCWQARMLDEAGRWADIALADAKSAQATVGLADAALLAGTVARMRGQLELAMGHYMRARDAYTEYGRVSSAGKAWNNLGVVNYMAGHWNEALVAWEGALRCTQKGGETSERLALLNNLGFLNLERGHFEAAEKAFLEGLALATKAKARRNEVDLAGNYAELLARTSRVDEAVEQLQAVVALAESLGLDAERIENLRRLAEQQLALGLFDAAEAAASAVLDDAERVGLGCECVHAQRVLALCALKRPAARRSSDRPERVESGAEECQRRLADARARLGDERGTTSAGLLALAEAEGALSTARFDAARDALDAARQDFARAEAAWHLTLVDRLDESLPSRSINSEVRLWALELPEAIAAIERTGDVGRALQEACDRLLAWTHGSRAAGSLARCAERKALRVVAPRESRPTLTAEYAGSTSVATRVLVSGQTVCLADVSNDAAISTAHSVVACRLRSILCVPLLAPIIEPDSPRETRGFLYVETSTFSAGRFEAVVPAAEALARAVANVDEHQRAAAQRRARSDMLAYIAHELRNPLTCIVGYAELFGAEASNGRPDDATATAHLLAEACLAEGARMSALIDDMGSLFQIEYRRSAAVVSTTSTAIVEAVARLARPSASESSVSIVTSTDESLRVDVDRGRVEQALINLVSNAIRYSPEGGTVRVTARYQAPVDPLWDRPMAVLTVADEGPGIPQGEQAAVFEKFRRGSSAKGAGTGLGLALADAIVAANGGSLWLESPAPGSDRGCAFHFTLPTSTD